MRSQLILVLNVTPGRVIKLVCFNLLENLQINYCFLSSNFYGWPAQQIKVDIVWIWHTIADINIFFNLPLVKRYFWFFQFFNWNTSWNHDQIRMVSVGSRV